jgi:hypothetical protein
MRQMMDSPMSAGPIIANALDYRDKAQSQLPAQALRGAMSGGSSKKKE